jgi:hypothetical protein
VIDCLPKRLQPRAKGLLGGDHRGPDSQGRRSGATAVRFGAYVAELCGVDLSDAPEAQLAVGGTVVSALMAEVSLHIEDDSDSHTWTAPVWFCDPWLPSFGLLGLTGFFDQFEVTIASYQEWFELTPMP